MLTEVQAGPYRLRGISLAGIYTSIAVPELDVLLDAGIAARSLAMHDRIFLSHAHADHASALGSVLAIRNLVGKRRAEVFVPRESLDALHAVLQAQARTHHCGMDVELHGLAPGDEVELASRGLFARAFRTHHPAPSLGYLFVRKVQKLRDEFKSLPGPEIGARRAAGDATLFESAEHLELAYATDTLATVLDTSPEILRARVLALECTYVGGWRTPEDARAHGHLHLDELAARRERFENEHLVLMHFSQGHSVAEVRDAVAKALAGARPQVHVFASGDDWFG